MKMDLRMDFIIFKPQLDKFLDQFTGDEIDRRNAEFEYAIQMVFPSEDLSASTLRSLTIASGNYISINLERLLKAPYLETLIIRDTKYVAIGDANPSARYFEISEPISPKREELDSDITDAEPKGSLAPSLIEDCIKECVNDSEDMDNVRELLSPPHLERHLDFLI